MNGTTLATAVAGLRVGIGSALLALPGTAGRIWIGPEADGAGTRVFARAIGARDVALGARTLQALQRGERADQLVQFGVLADAADTVASVLAFRTLRRARGILMPLTAGTVGVLGFLAWRELVAQGRAVPPGLATDVGGDGSTMAGSVMGSGTGSTVTGPATVVTSDQATVDVPGEPTLP